jgi:hypothetical protein
VHNSIKDPSQVVFSSN